MPNRERSRSAELWAEAQQTMPGGVNSPVRAFQAVQGDPVFMERGEGPHLVDADGNRYIDYVASWGPLILGHAHPSIEAAVSEALKRGTSFGTCSEYETRLAKMILEAYPSMDRVRLVNSGTEATMSAIRAARGFTGRDKIVKAAGCYHGHADYLLVKAGSGATTFGTPTSAGVPADFAKHTLIVPFNDAEAAERALSEHPGGVACVILEPAAGNMGLVPPAEGYLEALRKMTAADGALLIFDEVMTGFRVAYGGAQERYGVSPDMTCLGKIVGGGLPVGAYGGRADVMAAVAPTGPVYQAGTLSGNPLAAAAGVAALTELRQPGVYERLETLGAQLEAAICRAFSEAEGPFSVARVGSMLCAFFGEGPVTDYDGAIACDTEKFGRFHRAMLNRGVYLPPAQFEAFFVSTAHTEAEIAATERAFREAVEEAEAGGPHVD